MVHRESASEGFARRPAHAWAQSAHLLNLSKATRMRIGKGVTLSVRLATDNPFGSSVVERYLRRVELTLCVALILRRSQRARRSRSPFAVRTLCPNLVQPRLRSLKCGLSCSAAFKLRRASSVRPASSRTCRASCAPARCPAAAWTGLRHKPIAIAVVLICAARSGPDSRPHKPRRAKVGRRASGPPPPQTPKPPPRGERQVHPVLHDHLGGARSQTGGSQQRKEESPGQAPGRAGARAPSRSRRPGDATTACHPNSRHGEFQNCRIRRSADAARNTERR